MVKKKVKSAVTAIVLAMSLALTACGNTAATGDAGTVETGEKTSGETETPAPESKALEIALNVYYNDADHSYYDNESGESILVTGEGQYTLSFDCATDLSDKAVAAGVNSLTNLTAVYILDMGVAKGTQSTIKACNIFFDSVNVDGQELTVTQTEKKSAIKSSGIFDTNDPINGWDGSQVAEVSATSEHVANFTTITDAKKITVTFTLSDMEWEGDAPKAEPSETVKTGNTYVNTAKFSDLDFKNMDALTLSKYMGNGINLGNTLEAYGKGSLGTTAEVSTYETFWGQPVTTKEMILGMKNAGFDTLRIPVAWTNTMDYESGDFTINPAYLERVAEVVQYAIDAEMFVIVNDHWDGGWYAMFGSNKQEDVDRAWKIYENIWTQVADYFKDYSELLIFESANEELGDRFNYTGDWADSGSLTVDECYKLNTAVNQKFVDIVRNSGGKNSERFLLIAGYDTNFDKTVDSRFVMPTDTLLGKMLVSVHYYSPSTYCMGEKQADWGIKKDYEDMNADFAKLTKLTDAGYGVIIGEYATLMADGGAGILKNNTVEYTTNLLGNCDVYNYVPVLWSCNDFYKKDELTMVNSDITDLYTGRCYAEESKAENYVETVQAQMQAAYEEAPEMWEGVVTYEEGTPVAWIMWNGGAGTYSVGNTFNPADNTEGIKASNAIVEGPGEYTVSLDFEGGNTGLTFAALAVANGETLYPGCVIDLKQFLVDGEEVKLKAIPYTTSDDGICTRVNIINNWVTEIPEDARLPYGYMAAASAAIVDESVFTDIHNLTIVFELKEAE